MRITLIITGSIAIYKILDLIRLLKQEGISINPVMTKAAANFISPNLVAALSESPVFTEDTWQMEHIKLARNIDGILVAPCSADFLSKFANGIGGELALDILLSKQVQTPVAIAPAMNVEMWKNPFIQENVAKLQQHGVHLIAPESGILACGEKGEGKLASIDVIFHKTRLLFNSNRPLSGKRVLITAGATVEKIDSVRYISNFSSGKQGLAIANELALNGAFVTLIYGNITENISPLIQDKIQALSANDMFQAVKNNLNTDVFISVAAVSDFYVTNGQKSKIKKSELKSIEISINPDILSFVGNMQTKRPKYVIGFAAEDDKLDEYARKKLTDKGCDLIIANHTKSGEIFGNSETEGAFYFKDNTSEKFNCSKDKLAKKLAEILAQKLTN